MEKELIGTAPDRKNLSFFFLLLVFLIVAGALRSRIATRFDSFPYDEAYHIGSGAAYVKTRDFRLNPEHPPLVKLWVGTFVAAQGFHVSPYRSFLDKADERAFVQEDVYVNNNPDAVQRRTRTAMFGLNGLLLLLFAVAARRVLGEVIAISATAFLVVDPTTAAHFPVVMTDLPLALLSSTAVLCAVQAFRKWRITDLLLAAAILGLTLGTKHSAIVTATVIMLTGFVAAIFPEKGEKVHAVPFWRRTGSVALVGMLAVLTLWGLYLFRWNETPGISNEQFNRPLAAKIADIQSPISRSVLQAMAKGRLLPRAYIWGLADTIRAGAEGRAISILAFGNLYYSKAPAYYFPAIIAAKLPLGLLLLTMIGIGILISGRVARQWVVPLIASIVLAILFLLALIGGSSYGGVRHALPLFPTLALLASITVFHSLASRSMLWRGTATIAVIGALVSAIPAMRPWEYFNELAGGAVNAHRYFNDEGVDLSLRTKELAVYYHRAVKPAGEVPFVIYFSPRIEWERRGMDWVGKNRERDAARMFEKNLNGTFIFGANQLAPALWWDFGKHFRDRKPAVRFGNLFVFRGTFPTPSAVPAYGLYYAAVHGKIYVPEPDIAGAIELLERSFVLDPSAFFVALELGNQYLKIGNREKALRAYRLARENAPVDAEEIRELLDGQLRRVKTEPLNRIEILRNPSLE